VEINERPSANDILVFLEQKLVGYRRCDLRYEHDVREESEERRTMGHHHAVGDMNHYLAG